MTKEAIVTPAADRARSAKLKAPPKLLRTWLSHEVIPGRDYAVNHSTPVLRRLDGDEADAAPPAKGAPTPSDEQQLLLAVYAEVMASWRDLHSVRFRLLGLLPLVTLAVFAIGGSGEPSVLRAAISLVIALLGFAVTLARFIHEGNFASRTGRV